MLDVVARTSETAFGVCYDACFSQINLAFGKYSTSNNAHDVLHIYFAHTYVKSKIWTYGGILVEEVGSHACIGVNRDDACTAWIKNKRHSYYILDMKT